MGNTPCTVKNISLITVANGLKYEGGIDREGLELPGVQLVAETVLPDQRTYHCNNCGQDFDGADTYDEVKKHLGTFPLTS